MNRQPNEKQPSQPQPAQPGKPAQAAKAKDAKKEPSENTDSTRDAAARGAEGEGSYSATHRYNEGLREHIQKHDIEREAEAARQALEGDERQELEEAEQRGKNAQTSPRQAPAAGAGQKQTAALPPQPMPAKR